MNCALSVIIIHAIVVVVVVVYIFRRIRRTSCRVDKNKPHCHFIYTYIYTLVKNTVKMMLIHHPILQSLKRLKNTEVATAYHGFHYTGAGFSGLSFPFSFSTRHHRKSSKSLNMQCVTQTSYVKDNF